MKLSSFEKKLTFLFIIIFIGMCILGLISYQNNRAFNDNSKRVIHTHEVLLESEKALSFIKNIQLFTRGYTLTLDSSFISKLLANKQQVSKHVNNLKFLTRDNSQQQARIHKLKILINKRMEQSFVIVNQFRRSQVIPVAISEKIYEGERLMNQIEDVINDIQAEENRLLVARNEINAQSVRSLNFTFYVLLAVAAFFIVLMFFLVKNYLAFREKAEMRIKELNESLERRVEQKTNEVIDKEKRYHLVLDNMQEGIQIISFDWRYLYVNAALAKQGKYSSEELLGHTMMERYPGIENTEIFKVLKKCMEERISQRLENEFIYPNGEKGYYDLSIQPVNEGLFILSMDISERKRREIEKEQYTKELEEVLFKISHEVRHPVVQILGMAELLEHSLVPEEERPAILALIKEAATLLDTYTRDLSLFVTSIKNKE